MNHPLDMLAQAYLADAALTRGVPAGQNWLDLLIASNPIAAVLLTICAICICLFVSASVVWLFGQMRLMNAELQRREHQLRLFMDSVTDYAIYTLDRDGMVVHWDKGAERLMRYATTEILGQPFSLLFTEEDRRQGVPAEALKIAAAEGRYEADHWIVRKDRTGFWASGIVQPIIEPGGKLLGYATIVRDFTHRWLEQQALQQAKDEAEASAFRAAQLSAEVQAANEELKAANNKLLKFTSIVAHDLRAPLQRVEAFTELLNEDYGAELGDDGQDIISRIAAGVSRIRLMLTSLLDYSKRSSGSLQGKTASLANVIEAALEDTGCNAQGVEVKVMTGAVTEVVGDPLLLGHVLQNLIGNSIKFRRPDRTPAIVIEAVRIAGGEVLVSVSDNGIGVEPEYADRVFEMFYRLHDEDEYEGVGIGLSVCQKIIGDHGGRIWIDKTFTGGARVMFTLLPASRLAEPAELRAA
jgi:PAS domain S-box-containing protein